MKKLFITIRWLAYGRRNFVESLAECRSLEQVDNFRRNFMLVYYGVCPKIIINDAAKLFNERFLLLISVNK